MEKSTLVLIIEHIKKNNGAILPEHEFLIPMLESSLVIYPAQSHNGRKTTRLTEAFEVYYQQFYLMNYGFFLCRWLCYCYYHLLESNDVRNFKECVKKIEEITPDTTQEAKTKKFCHAS